MSRTSATLGAQLLKNNSGLESILYCDDGANPFKGKLVCAAPLAIETLRSQSDTGSPVYGQRFKFKIPRTGDVLLHAFIALKRSGIHGCATESDSTYVSGSGTCGLNLSGIPVAGAAPACSEADQAVAASYGGDGEDAVALGTQIWAAGQGTCGDVYVEYGDGDIQAYPVAAGADGIAGTSDDVAVQLPSLQEHYAAYRNHFMHAALSRVSLMIGTQEIEPLTRVGMHMWQQLSGRAGKELDTMIGSYESLDERILGSMVTRWFYCPLPFSFSTSPIHALRLAALVFAPLVIEVELAPLEEVLTRSTSGTAVHLCNTTTPVAPNNVQVELATMHVWLSEEARAELASTREIIYVMSDLQVHDLPNSVNTVRLTLNNPCTSFHFAVQRQCARDKGDYFDFSGLFGEDPVAYFTLRLNGADRVSRTEGVFFRTVQPWVHHSQSDPGFIYSYSFALFPEKLMVTGSLNFSKFDAIEAVIELQKGLEREDGVQLLWLTRYMNMIKVRNGTGVRLFS